MFNQLQKARKRAEELFESCEHPFSVVDLLNEEFEGFFYLNRGNIFYSDLKGGIADTVYLKRRNFND